MANKVLLKKSSVVAKVPTTSDLDYGELALNYADGKLYYKNASNTIAYIANGSGSGTAGGIFYVYARASTIAVTVNVGNLAVNARAGTVNVTI
jgi:hypothetical protein